jgi:hypothetical protein
MAEEQCPHKNIKRITYFGPGNLFYNTDDDDGKITKCRDCGKEWKRCDDYKHIPDRADPPIVVFGGAIIGLLFILLMCYINSKLDHSYMSFY